MSCSANSFTGDTPVLLADGTEKPIRDVKVGDRVRATDPQTGQTGSRPVTALIRHSGPHTMVDLTLTDGSVLHATDHHPIWNATTNRFTYAIDLQPGEMLQRPDGGLLMLATVHIHAQTVAAYNLTIASIHTYYAGTTPLLVHNSCSMANPASFSGASRAEAEQELAANGWQEAGSTRGEGGVRWRQPGNISNQVRLMPGKVSDPNPIKQGPYIRFSINGTKFGPYPLGGL